MITESMNFGFFLVQKWPFCDAHLLFKRKGLKPLFLLCFLGARFLGQGVKKRENLKSHQEKWKNLTDN